MVPPWEQLFRARLTLVSSAPLQRSTSHSADDMRKVLVLDSNQRSALAIIRSLGQRGLKVFAGDHLAHPLGATSRYAAGSIRYPSPETSPSEFINEINFLADRLAIDSIIPATDLTTMLLVSQPDRSKISRLAAPPSQSYETLSDKARLLELAGKLDVSAPETRISRTRAAVEDATRYFGFPVVLKPARSRYLKGDRVVTTSVQIATDAASLSRSLDQMHWLADIPCLTQRFIRGRGAGIFALYGPKGPIAWFAHRRIREKPPWGGVSVVSESVPIDAAMRSAAEKLLAAADWSGVAMVEFRVSGDGTPYLMEVNGRFWGSLQLAIDCGVDFPWLLHQLSQGMSPTHSHSYTVGKRLRWLIGDTDSLLIELRNKRDDSRSKGCAVANYFLSFADRHCRQEIMRLHDWRPGVHELSEWIKSAISE